MADFTPIQSVEVHPGVRFGGNTPVLIAGPCVIENAEITLEIAQRVKVLAASLGWSYIFKASYDKANRTSSTSFRSIGFEAALNVLASVREQVSVPVLTDIHETTQVKRVAECVDVLQIPAFLCRQTDLLHVAGETGLTVNIKRGQFMAPEDMVYAAAKIIETGNNRVFLTERGVTFGYHNLVVDMRALPIMRQFVPVVFDATHSVQQPGGLDGKSGGNREFVPFLARAAAATGIDGLFVETHLDPSKALSDGPNMVALDDLPKLLEGVLSVWQASRPYVNRLSS